MSKIDFINQLRLLGFEPQQPATDRVYFEWKVPLGINIGRKVLVGFMIDDSYPISLPTGPHFRAFDNAWKEHPQNIHASEFGSKWSNYPEDKSLDFYQSGWRYWSRPYTATAEKTAKNYMAHIKNILMTV